MNTLMAPVNISAGECVNDLLQHMINHLSDDNTKTGGGISS